MSIKNFYGELYNKNGVFNNNSNVSNYKKGITENVNNIIDVNSSPTNQGLTNRELKIKLSNIERNMNENKNENINENKNENINENKNENNLSNNYSIISIIFIIFIGIIVGIIYYFKDKIYDLYNTIMNKDNDLQSEIKELKKSLKKEKKSIKSKKIQQEKLKKLKEKGGIYDLQKKVNKSKYLEKKVNEDGFCFIGYDNGMRNCTEIYEGETCMSGELYPTLQHCMFPKLR